MNRPLLPRRPTADVDRISAAWLSKLLDCVQWAMDNASKPDNKTIFKGLAGRLYTKIPGVTESVSGAEIFWVEPSDGLSSTYSSDDRHIYGAYLHADCSGVWDDTVTSCYFWIPNHITSHEIVFPGPAPILPCIKTSIEIPVPEDAPEGTKPTPLTVYVPIDTGWVIR